MRVQAKRRLVIFAATPLALVAAGFSEAAAAEETATGQENAAAERRLAFMLERLGEMKIHRPRQPDEPYTLKETPLLRWNNPVSGVIDGGVFVWTDGERPVAIEKVHINTRTRGWGEAMQSLAAHPIEMRVRDKRLWAPAEPGLKFREVRGSGEPASSERGRLLQMRSIARRFRFTGQWGLENPTQWELRLLSEPLYRYSSEEEGIVDGAIFGFAQGTNPEGLAIVHAVRDEKGTRWTAAATRLTRYGVRAEFDGEVIADLPRRETFPPEATYYRAWRRLADFPNAP